MCYEMLAVNFRWFFIRMRPGSPVLSWVVNKSLISRPLKSLYETRKVRAMEERE